MVTHNCTAVIVAFIFTVAVTHMFVVKIIQNVFVWHLSVILFFSPHCFSFCDLRCPVGLSWNQTEIARPWQGDPSELWAHWSIARSIEHWWKWVGGPGNACMGRDFSLCWWKGVTVWPCKQLIIVVVSLSDYWWGCCQEDEADGRGREEKLWVLFEQACFIWTKRLSTS